MTFTEITLSIPKQVTIALPVPEASTYWLLAAINSIIFASSVTYLGNQHKIKNKYEYRFDQIILSLSFGILWPIFMPLVLFVGFIECIKAPNGNWVGEKK